MLKTKVFEIRDHGTFMVGVATKLTEADPKDPDDNTGWLLSNIGYKPDTPYPVLLYIPTMKRAETDYAWAWGSDKRTLPNAHQFITEHWDEVESGDVIDVRVALGETDTPCQSERYHYD